MENENGPNRETRKPYERPSVTMVPLRPEETIMGGCKTAGTSGSSVTGSCTTVLGIDCQAISPS